MEHPNTDWPNTGWQGAILEQVDVSGHRTDLPHDLGNLVQVVSGYLELLATRTEDETSLRYIGTAQTAAQQINGLAQDLERQARAAKAA